ncbi:MAG: UDP-N-acetylmuramate dehydrogenase [Candidatus Acidulodesulfobacterium sp.]
MIKSKEDLLKKLKEHGIDFMENQDMSSYSSIKTGGKADLILFPKNEAELGSLIKLTEGEISECFRYVVGGGTNTLFKEERICVPVISFKKFDSSVSDVSEDYGNNENEKCGKKVFRFGAGINLSKILNYSIKHNLSGCEFFYGIPGTLGGAVKMNAGSKESSVGNIVEAIDILDSNGSKSTAEKKDMNFSYRSLNVKGIKDNYFITSVYLRLKESSKSEIAENIKIFKERKSGQPLGEFSLGCIFKNPEGFSAGKIIEEIGFKGVSFGGAYVSRKHANFIINKGGAKPSDIIFLIDNIREKALESKGIKLDTEIKIV